MKTIRLAMAALQEAIMDTQHRVVEPMSTLIGVNTDGQPSDLWLIETSWDGASISDVVIYINRRCNPGSLAREVKNHDTGELYPHEWAYWGSVPASRVKNYKVLDADKPTPQTWGKSGAEPQAKAGKSPTASA